MKFLTQLSQWNLMRLAAVVLICRVTIGVLWNYPGYLPPDFSDGFLRSREFYFWNGYHWAFYAHLISGPTSLILGLILLSDRFRQKFPRWHRYLGRIQAINVLALLTPSGLWMAMYATTGEIAGAGFASLALVTGVCMALAWRTAVQRRFADHRVWTLRCFLCLCSAVIVRLVGGLATVLNYDSEWPYPAAAWLSWSVPLLIFEVWRRKIRIPIRIGPRRSTIAGVDRLSSPVSP